ncbi:MAG: glycerol-3-phosphate 1-O-acyltransferase PlsB, partial [Pseudomonadales bacterium]
VKIAIEREASSNRASQEKIEKKASAYANEIVSDQSYRVVRFFHVLLTWLWNKLYDGIDVYNIDQVKELAKSHEIVYTPCHRSHIDYLLLSYVLYHNGLTPPHIAAGRNLNLPIAGPLLRRGGAFFMRRSFQGDALYKAVFDEYLHLMFVRGYSVEYFIEGSRSRTGRLLTPRTGMLSMTMRSFVRDASRPMALLPIYFSYERVIEAPTYFGELAGKNKKEESIFDLLKIFQVFRAPFGKVAVSFGQPIIMGDFLDAELPAWQTPDQVDPADLSSACVILARQLATNINAAATLNPVNLVATALLCTPRQTMEESRLLSQVRVLKQIAEGIGGTIVTVLPPEEVVAESESVAGILRVKQPFGDLMTASADVTILLTYYRNSTAHIFALPSLIARIARTCGSVTGQRIIDICQTLYPYIKAEFFLRWEEQEVPGHCRSVIELLANLGLLHIKDDLAELPDPAREQFACLSELAEIIEPTLERFFIVSTLLQSQQNATIRDIESAAATIGHRLSTIYGINSPEFFDRSLFSTFISQLRAEHIISTPGNRIVVSDRFTAIRETTETTLDPDVRYNVLHVAGKLAIVTHSE